MQPREALKLRVTSLQTLLGSVALAAGMLGASVARAQSAQELQALRAEFRAAYDDARFGVSLDARGDSDPLERYVLYPYLEAARLEVAALGTSGPLGSVDAEVGAFLERHGSEPVTRSLRRTWLRRLAGRGEWSAFLDAYEAELADDRMRCQQLAARIETDRLSGLAPDIRAQWLTPRQLPIECEPVFQWLRDEGLLDDALVVERVTRLLENGHAQFARVIARRLPDDLAGPLEAWASFVSDPRSALDAWLTAPSPVADSVLLDGWSRLARDAPEEALARAGRLFAALAGEDRPTSRFALALAFGLAWDRRTEALDWFARVDAADFDDYALGWLARAALWAERWPLVADAIHAMSGTERASSMWRYWAARAMEALAGHREARDVYESLLSDDNFYAAMAAARLDRRLAPHPMPLPRDDARIAELATRPAQLRARELAAVGLRSEATLEWQYGYEMLDGREQLQSIHLAAREGLHDIAVATATRHGVFADYALLYPRPFESLVARAAGRRNLDATLLFAVMRQESLFRSDATSPSGALGLMQLTHGTATLTARELGLPVPARRDLFDPPTNIVLGSAHLSELLDAFDGQLPVALAAYNAGPNAARRWLPARGLEADIWIENIPYNETRAYVRRVLWHCVVFEWLEDGRAVALDGWLDGVSPAAQNR